MIIIIKNSQKKTKIKCVCILLLALILPTLISTFSLPIGSNSTSDLIEEVDDNTGENTNIRDLDSIPLTSSNEWWNSSWKYRIPIGITSKTGNLINYQVKININLTDMYDSGWINETGRDIRFVNISNDELDFWIEDLDVSGGNSTIWVKIPELKNNEETIIYMYTGNKDAISESSDAKTFIRIIDRVRGVWNFEEEGGITAYDTSGNGNHGTLINTPTWIQSIHGTGLKFDGTSEYVNVPYSASLNPGANLTMMAWINWTGGTGDQNIMTKESAYECRVNGGNIAYATNPWAWRGSEPITMNAWHHVVITNSWTGSSGTQKIFVDTRDEYTALSGGVITSNTNAFTIARRMGGTSYFRGEIDEVILFNKPLNQEEISDVYNNSAYSTPNNPNKILVRKYTTIEPEVSIGEVSLSFRVTCVDIDGFRVPNALISISNNSQPNLNQANYTDANGEVVFSNVSMAGIYNITVQYTQNGLTGAETETVYFEENYQLLDYTEKTIRINLWTINFELSDYDGDPFEYGYVELYNITNSIVGNASLNDEGMATIRWTNQPAYNFSVYFDSSRLSDSSIYNKKELLVYKGNVSRENPNGPKYNILDRAFLDEELEVTAGNIFAVIELSPQSKGYISEFNISVSGVEEYIDTFIVEVNVDKVWDIVYSYHDSGEELQEHSFVYNYTEAEEVKLTLYKINSAANNGTIRFTYVNSTNVIISLKFSKIRFNVTDDNGVALQNALVQVYNETDTPISQIPIALLKVDGQGYATYYGLNNQTTDWGNHTILIEFAGDNRDFGLIKNNWFDKDKGLNISFDIQSNYSIIVNLNTEDYKTNLTLVSQNPLNFLTDVYWKDNVSLKVNFTTIIESIVESKDPDNIIMMFFDQSFKSFGVPINLLMYKIATGVFNITFNTTTIGLKGGYSYTIRITASKAGYTNPDVLDIPIEVLALQTNIQMHDYENMPAVITKVSNYYQEKVNITVSYYNTSRITGALLRYYWNWGSGSNIGEDPLNIGYYTFEINTSLADETGTYPITITMELENYTTKIYVATLVIMDRPTTVNGTLEFDYLSKSVYVQDEYYFNFNYSDNLIHETIVDAVTSYTLQKLDDDGRPIESETILGTMNETSEHLYVLDLDTEDMAVSRYFIFLTFQKKNYNDMRIAISFEIEKRIFDISLSDNFDENKAEIVKGEDIVIELKLTDLTKGDIALKGAKVTLTIGDNEYEFEEDKNGIYTLTLSTKDIDAFFTSQTQTGEITIEKENYETETIDITIVVNMEEIYPGIPTFYFILGSIAIVGVVGSLVTSKVIRSARIPKYVKKVRAIKKTINSRKSLSESLMYPSKLEAIKEMFGENWEAIGASIEDSLQIKKGKSLSDAKLKDENREGVEM